MSEYLLQTKNLSKTIHKQKIVKNVNLNVRKNKVYGLLGPNGAGKSSTLKMITGIWNPTCGKIIVNGHPWSRKDLHTISALIETPPLYDNLTAMENLQVKATQLGIPKQRMVEVLQIVDLTQTGKKRAKEFSLGMKQRLGIALALLNDPELLILDEPTNGLDPVGIQELRSLIRSFTKHGITVILSSHILSEVQQVADDIGIITNGQLAYEGAIDQSKDLENLFMEVIAEKQKEEF